MLTEQYKGWKPWVCSGCSAELQFSESHDLTLQLCFFGIALLPLYLLGVRGWQLAVGIVLVGFALAFVLGGPLTRILPPRLEPYRPLPPLPWKESNVTTLFPREHVDSDNPKLDHRQDLLLLKRRKREI